MDDSSRKIVLLIGIATVATLLFMAARYFLGSSPAPVATAVQDSKSVAPAEPVPAPENKMEADAEQSDLGASLPEEDGFPPMGEPTVNIEEGGNSASYPPVESNPQPAPEQMPQLLAEAYDANN